MPTVGAILCPGQSQAGFFRSNVAAYKETALSAVLQTGSGEMKAEVERRLPGWTLNQYGNIASNPGTTSAGDTGAGGSSFVNDTIDPTAGPGDTTPLSGNTDTRLVTLTGRLYMTSIDSIIAANNATTDYWIVYHYFQTWDIDEGSISGSRYYQCLALQLWYTLLRSKLQATGKPFRMYIVTPGFSERGGRNWYMGLLHECHNHMSQNGYRSNEPSISGFSRIPDLYLLCGANMAVSFDDARKADNTFVSVTDLAHPSVGSSIRLARQMALGISRWLDPSVSQEYNGIPYVESFEYHPTNPLGCRVKVKITPGNRLVWQDRVAEDVSTMTLGAGYIQSSSNPGDDAQVLVQAHRFYTSLAGYQPLRPEVIDITSIGVDNTYSSVGYGYLNIELFSRPTYGTCFSIQPSQFYKMYTRIDDTSIGPGQKFLMGLREEAGTSAYSITASCEDILESGKVFLPVTPVTSMKIQNPTGIEVSVSVSVTVSTSDSADAIMTEGLEILLTESGIEIWRDL